MPDLRTQTVALRDDVGYCDLSGRSQIELTGADRGKVLHGLCTNDIKRLSPGDGCEAFLTNIQGKTTSYVTIFCLDDSLVIDTSPGLANYIIPALDRYVIREDVTFADLSDQWSQLLLSGSQAEIFLSDPFSGSIPSNRIGIAFGEISGVEVQVRRMPYASSDCFFVCCDSERLSELLDWLDASGAIACSNEAVNVARIEMGVPIFGQDVTADNLPQELSRDEFAISFTKGCYLGQETVARIDAMGHVNRRLMGLKFSGESAPPVSATIDLSGKQVAVVTSSCFSNRLNASIALAFIRRGSDKPGTILSTKFGDAEVIALPFE